MKDFDELIAHLDSVYKDICSYFGVCQIEGGYFLGGCIRNTLLELPIKDYDFYFSSPELRDFYLEIFRGFPHETSANQKNLIFDIRGKKVEFMVADRLAVSPLHGMELVDFTINQTYYRPDTGDFYIREIINTLKVVNWTESTQSRAEYLKQKYGFELTREEQELY